MYASSVNLNKPIETSSITSSPSNGTPSRPIASAQAAIQKSPASASSPKISKTVETFDAKLLQGLKDAGHALPSNTQKPLKNFLTAVYQSFKAGGKDIAEVKSAFQALQKALNPSSQKALPIILNSAMAWAKGRLKDKGWETTELQKFFSSKATLVKPAQPAPTTSKSCLSTTGKVVLGLSIAANVVGVGFLIYKYALPYFYPPTDDDKMTSLYTTRYTAQDTCLDPELVVEEMTKAVHSLYKDFCPTEFDAAPFIAKIQSCYKLYNGEACYDSTPCAGCRRKILYEEVPAFCKNIAQDLVARLIGNGRT